MFVRWRILWATWYVHIYFFLHFLTFYLVIVLLKPLFTERLPSLCSRRNKNTYCINLHNCVNATRKCWYGPNASEEHEMVQVAVAYICIYLINETRGLWTKARCKRNETKDRWHLHTLAYICIYICMCICMYLHIFAYNCMNSHLFRYICIYL